MLHTETVTASTLDLLTFPLRGLMYFDDAEEDPMPEIFDGNLSWENVKKTVIAATRDYVLD